VLHLPSCLLSARSHCAPMSSLFLYATLFRSEDGQRLNGHEELPDRAIIRDRSIARSHHMPSISGLPARFPFNPEMQSGLVGLRRSEEHTSELQSLTDLVCRLLLEKKKPTSSH